MKIDLEKELGLNQSAPPDNSLWLKAILFLCVANFLFLVILFFNSKSNRYDSARESSFAEINSQFIANVSARLTNIEQLQRQMKITQKKSKKVLSIAATGKKLELKHERMEQKKLKKSGLTDEEFDNLGSSIQNKNAFIDITDQEKDKLDDLIDRDESGAQIRAYINALPSIKQRKTVIEYLKKKGNQWFRAALPLLNENDPDADIYVENTKYFFEIIRDVSRNSAIIAYAGSKLNQLELAVQRSEIKRISEEERINRQNEFDNLKDDLAPRETAEEAQSRILRDRKRNSIIKPYSSSKITHPYKSDWDPDPRVREEQGIQ